MMNERRLESLALIKAAKERRETVRVWDELVDVFFTKLEDQQGCALDIELWSEALTKPRVKQVLRGNLREIRRAFVGIIRGAQERKEVNPALDAEAVAEVNPALDAEAVAEVNPALDAEAVAEVMISFFDGLVLQKAIDPGVDVWTYVAVIKAMMGGEFWQGGEGKTGARN